MENGGENYLASVQKLFRYYKLMADRAIAQVSDEQLHWQYNAQSNSIAIIMQHIAGNSLSRWQDFLNSDGEKAWRNRDEEFEANGTTKTDLLEFWEKGWQCLFDAIDPLTKDDLTRIIYIRNEGHTVIEAINRQLAHIPSHIGQIIFLGKMLAGEDWQTLSIAKGQSQQFNAGKFSDEKEKKFFTDGMGGKKA